MTFVRNIKKEGWKGELPLYSFNCPEHGIVEAIPEGYKKKLICPVCRARKEEERNK